VQRSIIAPAERVTNLRWGIAVLLGAGVVIGSVDRIILLASSRMLARDFGIGVTAFGSIVLAAGLAYLLSQIPFGALLDRFGVTLFGRISTFCWSVVALFSSSSLSYGGGFGPADSPVYALSAKATGYWFPASERGLSTAIFDGAAKLATAIGVLVAPLMLINYGWQATFLAAGFVSFLFFGAFYVFYRDPIEHPGLTHAERQHISLGGAQQEGRPASGTFVFLLRQPKMWGLILGFAAYSYSCSLLLLVPGYLWRTFGVAPGSSGVYTAIPWLVAAIVEVLLGGFLVDAIIKRSQDAARVRKTVLVIGMLLGLSVFGTATTRDSTVALAYIALAYSGLALAAPVVWSLPSLIAPRGAVGLTFSTMNFAGILAAIAAPVIGTYFAEVTANYSSLFFSTVVVLIVGFLSYVFLLGRIEPLAEPE
jgi:ACS family D-galactonate transporter-like MFS transporter